MGEELIPSARWDYFQGWLKEGIWKVPANFLGWLNCSVWERNLLGKMAWVWREGLDLAKG